MDSTKTSSFRPPLWLCPQETDLRTKSLAPGTCPFLVGLLTTVAGPHDGLGVFEWLVLDCLFYLLV